METPKVLLQGPTKTKAAGLMGEAASSGGHWGRCVPQA